MFGNFHIRVLSHFSCVQLCAALWTIVCQASLSMGCSRQEYWSGLPCPPLRDLPTQESNLCLMSPALAGRFFTTSTTWEPPKSSPKPVTKNRGWGIFLYSLSFRALVLNCFSWFSPHKALFFFSTSGSNHYCSLTDDYLSSDLMQGSSYQLRS